MGVLNIGVYLINKLIIFYKDDEVVVELAQSAKVCHILLNGRCAVGCISSCLSR